eukprot:3360550-Lingulodinium_polyedra.AAC.1
MLRFAFAVHGVGAQVARFPGAVSCTERRWFGSARTPGVLSGEQRFRGARRGRGYGHLCNPCPRRLP